MEKWLSRHPHKLEIVGSNPTAAPKKYVGVVLMASTSVSKTESSGSSPGTFAIFLIRILFVLLDSSTMAVQLTVNQQVVGSSPTYPAKRIIRCYSSIGRAAVL